MPRSLSRVSRSKPWLSVCARTGSSALLVKRAYDSCLNPFVTGATNASVPAVADVSGVEVHSITEQPDSLQIVLKTTSTTAVFPVCNTPSCHVHTFRRFAEGLRGDEDAVKAALSLPWSNGQLEGQINRLKTLKRQMYGRASFDLPRRRFLAAA